VVDHPYTAKIDPLKGNEWFNAPAGTLMTLGSFTETAAQSAAKREKRDAERMANQKGVQK
jgi:hypothetical protein